MDNEAEQAFAVDQGQYYSAPTGYGYYGTGFENEGDWVNQSSILQLDGPDLHHPAQHVESLPYAYYPPNYAYGQSAYNPFNPYIPGALVGTDDPFVVSQPFYRGSPYQQMFYSPNYFPINQPGVDTSTFGLSDDALPDSSMTNSNRLDGGGAEYIQSSSVSTAIIPEGTSQSLNTVRKIHSPAANIQTHQSRDEKPTFNTHRAAYNSSTRLPLHESITCRERSSDTLTEQNASPRSNNIKDPQRPVISSIVHSSQIVGNETPDDVSVCPDQYDDGGFPVSYADAKFFVIKSYSEDDIHKSIKYNVWSSTPNGNKRLDAAYHDAERRSCGNHRACPMFLFFSVNASGKFCGVAEMIGPVDFQKDMNFWQQDKWSGSFPVKWHLIKDVPNPNFRHIRLENNENKPVTNSRDTQEVKYIEGIEMLKIFKRYAARTSILDDFMYYEERQQSFFPKKPKQQNQVDMNCSLPSRDTNNTVGHDERGIRAQALLQAPSEAKDVSSRAPVGDIENSSIMKIGSLRIDQKENPGNISTVGSEGNISTDTVTVGSMIIKINGFACAPFSSADKISAYDEDASSLLTIGTISFDPNAVKQGGRGSFKDGNGSTC